MGRPNGDRAVKKCLLIKLEVFKIFNKLRVEKFIKEVRSNLDSKESELIKAFVNLKELSFPKAACVLVIDTSFSYNTGFYLAVNEDMFNEVDRVSEDSEYTDGLILVDNFILYSRDKIGFDDFFIENETNKIYINDYDINDFSLKDIRENLTYISQSELLYNDTIKNNIISTSSIE